MNRTSTLIQAAIVLNSLPKQQAAQLLSRLEPGDMKLVLDAVTRLDDVSAGQINECLKRLAEDSVRWRLVETEKSTPEVEEAKQKIDQALATKVSRFEKSIESENPFGFLLETIPMLREHVLADEHPKNIAIVLSTFPPEIASETMNGLDRNLRVSVLKRMCELDEIHNEDITELGFALRMRLNKLLNSRAGKSAGMTSAANLLSCSDAGTREALLAYIGQSDPDLASKLKRSVFGVERLLSMDDKLIKTVLGNVDTSYWAPALKNADPELLEKVLENMGPEPREILSREIDEIGFVASKTEDKARKNIVQIVLRLAREGKIDLRKERRAKTSALFPVATPSNASKSIEIESPL